MCPWYCWNIPASCYTFPSQKLKHFLAKIGKNWPKRAVRTMRICATARTQVLGGYLFHPWAAGIKVSWAQNHSYWTNHCQEVFWKLISHWNDQSQNSCANTCASWKISGNQRWFNVNIKKLSTVIGFFEAGPDLNSAEWSMTSQEILCSKDHKWFILLHEELNWNYNEGKSSCVRALK